MELLYAGCPHVCMYAWEEEESTFKIKKNKMVVIYLIAMLISVFYPNIEKFVHW